MSQTDSQNDEHRTREDGPEYRSVMIQPLRAPETRRLFSPLEKVNKSTTTFNHDYRNSEEKLTQLPSSNYRWEVEELEDLPVDYVLVRTNVYVKDSSAQLVATRISDALKSLSITIDLKGVETKVRFVYSSFDLSNILSESSMHLNLGDLLVPSLSTEFPFSRNSAWLQACHLSLWP
jgi:hypothetical protein